jgi:predicted Fe-Mo cluster-binding NifX family protein
MRIAISAKDKNIDSEIESRFGRCSFFLIVDSDTMSFESISNESGMSSGGAGIQAAQTVARAGVEVVITGNMGPNAFQTLSAAGIKVFTGADGTVKSAIERYKKGELKEIKSASVGSHFGMRATGGGFGRGDN